MNSKYMGIVGSRKGWHLHYQLDLCNWLVGVNWCIASHEVEDTYFAVHFLIFHFCLQWVGRAE